MSDKTIKKALLTMPEAEVTKYCEEAQKQSYDNKENLDFWLEVKKVYHNNIELYLAHIWRK